MKVIVTGGGGFLGKALCLSLAERGDEVHSLSRGDYPELRQAGVHTHRIDISSDTKELCEVFNGAQAVFHVAAKVDMWGVYDDFFRINVQGTRNVLSACREAGVPRLIYTSSPSVVADGKDLNGIDESYPYPDHHHAYYPKTKKIAEREVLAAHGDRLQTIALRPHLIWGPGDTNLVPTILERTRAGRLVQVGAGTNLTDICYISDCVQAHLLAEQALRESHPEAGGRAFFVSQGEPVNMWDWINEIVKRNGLDPITKRVPFPIAYGLATILEFAHTVLPLRGEPLLTRFLVLEMATSHYFSLEAAKKILGYQPQYTVNEALDITFPKERPQQQELKAAS